MILPTTFYTLRQYLLAEFINTRQQNVHCKSKSLSFDDESMLTIALLQGASGIWRILKLQQKVSGSSCWQHMHSQTQEPSSKACMHTCID